MRWTTLQLSIVSLLLSAAASGQPEYQEFLSAPGGDSINTFSFYKTPDGGGFTHMLVDGLLGEEVSFTRVDANGVPVWSKGPHYVAAPNEPFYSTPAATPDNGLVIWTTGMLESLSADSAVTHRVAVKLDPTGQVEWARRYTAPTVTNTGGTYLGEVVTVLPDGSVITVSLWWDFVAAIVLDVIKVASDGTPLWSMTREVALSSNDEPALPRTAVLSDGSIVIAFASEFGGASVDVLKINANGQLLWHKHHVMNDAAWVVQVLGMTAQANGNFLVHGYRDAGQPDYMFLMWFTTDGDLYRHRLSDQNDYAVPLAWNDEGIWQWHHFGWILFDSTGMEEIRRFSLLPPGFLFPVNHLFFVSSVRIEPDTVWMSGVYRTVNVQTSEAERRPFLLRVAHDPLTGCRFNPLGPMPFTYIDVPDSLMIITTEGPALPDVVTYVDTAVVLVDLPLPTTYDFCSIVSVEETEPTPDAIQLWPDPIAQGAVLNIQSTVAADLTIFDTRGRTALRNNELLATRVVNTASLAKGTYMAVGCDKKGVRLWSRPFVVL